MNKKSIILSFIIIAILAVGFVALMPELAAAEGGRNVHFGPTDEQIRSSRVSSSVSAGAEQGGRNTTVTYTGSTGDEEQPVLYRGPALSRSTSVETEPVEGQDESKEFSSLAANALFGGNSFLPSGLTQWILFIIFILLMVILVRRLSGAEFAYQTSPLKHD